MATKKATSLEVSSDQIGAHLGRIEDRLAALETIASLANKSVVADWAKESLKSEHAKKIMKGCANPRTKDELKTELKYASIAALDYHLKPLREHDLLQESSNDEGLMTFVWSNLFSRLPKRTIDDLLK